MREKEVRTLRLMLELSDTKTRDFITTARNSYIWFICECFLYVVNGNVPANKNLLKSHKYEFILSKENSLKEKRPILEKRREPLKSIGLLCYLYLK